MEAALKLYEREEEPMPDSVSCIKTPIHQEKWIVLTILTHSNHPESYHSLISPFFCFSPFFGKSWQIIIWLSGACLILVGWLPSPDDRKLAGQWLPLT